MVCIDWLYAEVQEEAATALPQHRSTVRPVTKAAVTIASPATSAEQTAAEGEDAANAPNLLSKHAIDVPQTCKAGQCPMLQPVLQQQQQQRRQRQRHVWDNSLQPGSVVPASYLQIHPASKQQLKQHTSDVLDSKSGRQLQAQQPVTVRETCFDTW
jgi:hypothetical protein